MKSLNILMFRTFWYPNNGPGTRRMEAFAKHLAARGHKVTYLALKAPEASGETTEIEGCQTVLLSSSLRTNSMRSRFERVLRRWYPQADFHLQANDLVESAAAELIGKESFDCLITTYMPMGSLSVASRLHRRFGIPWIADLRDLPDQFDPNRKNWEFRNRARLLGRFCETASHLTTVSPPLKAALEERYSPTCEVSVVYNGYEEVDAAPAHRSGDSPTFAISYFGMIYVGRSLQLLQAGLDILLGRGVSLNRVEVSMYGKIEKNVLGLDYETPSAQLFSFKGFVSHSQAMAAMRGSAVLVSLASPGAKGILTSKIFEYAISGRPVLSIPRDHDVLDAFIEETRIGKSCESAEAVADYLGGLLAEWRATGRLPENNPDVSKLSTYSRRAQASVFTGIVEAVCEARDKNDGIKVNEV